MLTPRGQRGVVEQARSHSDCAADSLCALDKILPFSVLPFPHLSNNVLDLGVPREHPTYIQNDFMANLVCGVLVQVGTWVKYTFGQYRVTIPRLKQGSTA